MFLIIITVTTQVLGSMREAQTAIKKSSPFRAAVGDEEAAFPVGTGPSAISGKTAPPQNPPLVVQHLHPSEPKECFVQDKYHLYVHSSYHSIESLDPCMRIFHL